MKPMKRFSAALLLALLAASCNDSDSAGDSGIDAGPDADSDTDVDTDTDADCECDSVDDAYCLDDCVMMLCDGCHFAEDDCCEGNGDGTYNFCDPYTLPSCGSEEVEPECLFSSDDFCADELTLMECQVFDDVWDNYFEETDCYDPVNCGCGSGCVGEGDSAGCWCCTDGGTDAGADGGV
jgi:hypothetical protein